MRPHVVAFVFARGGSKGLPGKNLRPLGGKPLVAWAIETARASPLIDRVVLSTDDPEIAAVGRAYGAEAPFLRPPELATDEAPEWLAWRHAIGAIEAAPGGRPIDLFVSLSPTSPLRAVGDVDACIGLALEGDCDVAITVTPAHRNPWFNMVARDPDGNCRLVNRGGAAFHQRQAAPEVFDMTTVAYAVRPTFVMAADGIFAGRVKAVVVPPERAVDIDTELDLRFAEFLLRGA
jgi:N-acylneuraminate cytidylyltransferase